MYAYLIAAAMILGGLGWSHHLGAKAQQEVDAKITAQLSANVAMCVSANASNDATITALQDSIRTCESGRKTDAIAEASALAAQQATTASAIARYQDATAKLATLLATPTCRIWAKQAACTNSALPGKIVPSKSKPPTGAK